MTRFVLNRLLLGVVLLWLVVTVVFLALHAVPGDPAAILLGSEGSGAVTPEALARVRSQLGLDKPILVQYSDYLAGLVRMDFGTSFRSADIQVLSYIGDRLPKTLELVLMAALIAVVVGIPTGALAARIGGLADTVISSLTTLGISMPVYVIGTVFVLVFSLQMGWFPAGGYTAIEANPSAHFMRLVLPAIALSFGITSVVARMTRSAVLETVAQDWVRTARSQGLPRSVVFRRHVIRNSLNPVVTTLGLEIGSLLGSTVLIERVFTWPGMGSLLVDSVNSRDYPMVQGIVIVIAALFILINLIVDILYGVLDPRARR
ncbi:ABC transporter permease [Propioniciclava tarda]|uniref:ABC transporter permease n=1 Tax=Propioniciclava tarda TaxID=433330 RepID=A0A4Q9KR59_PROTD|nr:ABC transporter permease [Propioniciclava tarda]TBT96429.1 ABC transporter permease [Propioniciclava tarda]SMO38037.1 peptide/nickel transport system permease protein [Propioniciclava tarda]HQA31745.1 ABC transporter permease [Propioniciclava tarda]